MQEEVGAILEGKVTGMTDFGAFVELESGKTGMVHISEVSSSFVKNIRGFLEEGQTVKVKVLSISDNGRINLSIKKAQDPPAAGPRRSAPAGQNRPYAPRPDRRPPREPQGGPVTQTSGDATFEDKLKRFMQDSESKMSGSRQYSEKKVSRRRGNWNGGGGDY